MFRGNQLLGSKKAWEQTHSLAKAVELASSWVGSTLLDMSERQMMVFRQGSSCQEKSHKALLIDHFLADNVPSASQMMNSIFGELCCVTLSISRRLP